MTRWLLTCATLCLTCALAQVPDGDQAFRQLEDELPTPTSTRNASGAPGHAYWQQRVDYRIEASLDEATHRIQGRERITYSNNSPDTLRYLWVQLDQNLEAQDAEALRIRTTDPVGDSAQKGYDELGFELFRQGFPGGHTVEAVEDGAGQALEHRIQGTMLKILLPRPLAPGAKQELVIAWRYTVRDISHYYSRTGYELLEGDPQNPIYTIAHWYPRMAAYSDRYGWHVHHYVGEEFALEFGDFEVSLTVPADYVVASTGELQNPDAVLSAEQRKRLDYARTAEGPVFVVTPEEAKQNEAEGTRETKTWTYAAKQVRDFAWAASRKYAWDAWGVKVGERTVMAMSYYPNEAEPLWSKYSTHAVAHTLEHYGRYLPYPYPVALSCNGAVGGMEHPMISFQSERPEKDGTYSERQKYGLISVILHEVGHNWFPMIVNNDERRWRWMDEGFNSFVQQVAEGFWSEDYPSRNDARRDRILGYMRQADDQPIMTNTSLLIEGGNNAYAKTTLALTVLREAVLGREVFDEAFAEYCRRWAFKRPMPADFFRTMEDAAGVDLDWFFRGWFYGTDHVDLAVTGVRELELQTRDPEVDKPRAKAREEGRPVGLRRRRNREQPKRLERHPELSDYYDSYDAHAVTPQDREAYQKLLEGLEPHERALLALDKRIYVIDVQNVGGLPMPLPFTFHFADGTTAELTIPATVWRRSRGGRISKLFFFDKELVRVVLDADDAQADVDLANNAFPRSIATGTLELTKEERQPNPMQREREAKAKAQAQAPEAPAEQPQGEGDLPPVEGEQPR
ncbi:MAG: M1 family metallopeptidase [Planctomycetota bacterium]